jgi:hypothetical protein
MKKVLSVLHTYDEKLGAFFSGTAVGQILIAIILAAAVAFATSIADGMRLEYKERDFYNAIAISNSRAYIESELGPPRYEVKQFGTNFTDAKYYTKHGMVRVFYNDNDNTVAAYFITSKDKSYNHIGLADYYTGGKPVGSYTYQMIEGIPDKVKTYQGKYGWEIYLEKYFYENENGESHYYMYVDKYGFDKNEFISEDEYWSDEELVNIDMDFVEGFQDIFPDRSKSYPNTYGACIDDCSDIIEECLLYTINY